MLGMLLFALIAFTFGYALPHPHGLIGALAIAVLAGVATIFFEGFGSFAWLTWVLAVAVVAAAALGGRAVRERFGLPGGRAAAG